MRSIGPAETSSRTAATADGYVTTWEARPRVLAPEPRTR
jgi:hypothetical protein